MTQISGGDQLSQVQEGRANTGRSPWGDRWYAVSYEGLDPVTGEGAEALAPGRETARLALWAVVIYVKREYDKMPQTTWRKRRPRNDSTLP